MNKVREMGLKGRFYQLPNFIDYYRFKQESKWKEKTIVYFGRLIKIKGLITLFDAVKELKAVKLKIIGDGPLREELMLKAEKENIKNIIFSGYKKGKALQEEIKKAMFVILPSEVYENNPYSILESFALGKPVVGSHIGGIPELCKENLTGLTFTPGNSRELRQKIKILVSNPHRITEMGENARNFIEEMYDPGQYYEKLVGIYKKVLER